MQFIIGIIVSTHEQIDKVYKLIMNTYPQASGRNTRTDCHIKLPFVDIWIITASHARGCRFDLVYYHSDVPQVERDEIIIPTLLTQRSAFPKLAMRPLSELYDEIMENNNGKV